MLRGIRGAIQIPANDRKSVVSGAETMMRAIIETNHIVAAQAASVFFTVTPDLNAAFPAEVRSKIGWEMVPFLCSQEIPVPGAMPRIVRVLVLCETEMRQEDVRHQYIGAASALRPDLKSEALLTGENAKPAK